MTVYANGKDKDAIKTTSDSIKKWCFDGEKSDQKEIGQNDDKEEVENRELEKQ